MKLSDETTLDKPVFAWNKEILNKIKVMVVGVGAFDSKPGSSVGLGRNGTPGAAHGVLHGTTHGLTGDGGFDALNLFE